MKALLKGLVHIRRLVKGIGQRITGYRYSDDKEKCLQLQSILDHMPAIISLTDRSGKFILVNDEFAKAYGFSNTKSAEGKTDYDIHPHDRAEIASAYNRFTIETGETSEREICLTDGEQRTYLVSKFPVYNSAGKIYAIGSIGTDVTQRKRDEQELRAYQNSRTIGALTSRVAHDFNNLLTVLMGNIELLEFSIRDPELLESVHACCRAIEQGAALTSNLLTISGRHATELELANLDETIMDYRVLLESAISEDHSLKLICQSKAVTRIVVNQLTNAVLNLVVNADQAMKGQSGCITVTTQIVENEFVEVSVIDSGPGIPKAIRNKVIEPFFTTKERDTGTGLGLAMVNGFAEQSNGYLHIDDAHPGARVSIGLPIIMRNSLALLRESRKRETERQPTLRRFINQSRGASEYWILIVDDNGEILKMLNGILRIAKIHCVLCENFAEVQHAMSQHDHFDLAIIDLRMPDISGIELCRWLLARRPILTSVLMSGNFTDEDIERARTIGVKHFISKPFSIKEIMYVLLSCGMGTGEELMSNIQSES